MSVPRGLNVPLAVGAANYCQFRGMLMKSTVYFKGRGNRGVRAHGASRLESGPPRLQPLKALGIVISKLSRILHP